MLEVLKPRDDLQPRCADFVICGGHCLWYVSVSELKKKQIKLREREKYMKLLWQWDDGARSHKET